VASHRPRGPRNAVFRTGLRIGGRRGAVRLPVAMRVTPAGGENPVEVERQRHRRRPASRIVVCRFLQRGPVAFCGPRRSVARARQKPENGRISEATAYAKKLGTAVGTQALPDRITSADQILPGTAPACMRGVHAGERPRSRWSAGCSQTCLSAVPLVGPEFGSAAGGRSDASTLTRETRSSTPRSEFRRFRCFPSGVRSASRLGPARCSSRTRRCEAPRDCGSGSCRAGS
jgi:hypothetical protein